MITRRTDGYEIDTDPARVDVELVHRWLSTDAYWAKGCTRAVVEQSIRASVNFGVYAEDGQVGYARVVTDLATFGWLSDVYIERAHRGKGIGTWLAGTVREHFRPYRLKRLMLATSDAHEVYAKVGFTPVPDPHRLMVLR